MPGLDHPVEVALREAVLARVEGQKLAQRLLVRRPQGRGFSNRRSASPCQLAQSNLYTAPESYSASRNPGTSSREDARRSSGDRYASTFP